MAVTDDLRSPAPDNVEDVAWNLEPLVEGKGAAGVDELIDRAEAMVPAMLDRKGQVAAMDAASLVDFMQTMSDLQSSSVALRRMRASDSRSTRAIRQMAR